MRKAALLLIFSFFFPALAKAGGTVLFVAGTTAPPGTDPFITARLSALGFTVQVEDDDTVTAADALGKAFVFISETSLSGTLGSLFRDTTVPVIVGESSLYDDMEMCGPTSGTDYGNAAGQTSAYISGPAHYLADGYTNTVAVFSPGQDAYWGVPAPSAAVVAVLATAPAQAAVFAYEPGQPMDGGFIAPARRLGFFLGMDAADAMTAAGQDLLDRAILWAAGAAPPTATPTRSPSRTASPSQSPSPSPTLTPSWTPTATATGTASPSGTPSWTATLSFTPTVSPTLTWTVTDPPTATLTSTETPSSSATPSLTASATPLGTPTSTQTFSHTPSITASFTFTPQLSPTPTQALAMQALVYDLQGSLIRDLGILGAPAPASSLSLGTGLFEPEKGGLSVTAGTASWSWDGGLSTGMAAPNGRYRVVVKQAGLPDLEKAVWLVHGLGGLGRALFYPAPARGAKVNLILQNAPGVGTQLRLHNLAGELSANFSFAPGTALATLDLRSPGGQVLPPGIYAAVFRFQGAGGSSEIVRLKLAVLP